MHALSPRILTKSGNVDIVREFLLRGVSFLIVGGAAVAVHGCRELTDVNDLDLMIDSRIENTRKIVAALTAQTITVSFSAVELSKSAIQVPIKFSHYWMDLLTPERPDEFDEYFARSMIATLHGMQVNVASVSDLIELKETAVARFASDLTKHERDLECLRTK
jgi:hypothetical protein